MFSIISQNRIDQLRLKTHSTKHSSLNR